MSVPAEASQFSYGTVERLFAFQSTAVGWGDVAVLLPWKMYRRYADETGLCRAATTLTLSVCRRQYWSPGTGTVRGRPRGTRAGCCRACLDSWWLPRRGAVTRYTGRAFPGRVVLVVVIATTSVVGSVLGGFLWAAGFGRSVDFSVPDDVWDYNAYLGANFMSGALAGLTALFFLGLWHRREYAPSQHPGPSLPRGPASRCGTATASA